jgi:hypothetical protein
MQHGPAASSGSNPKAPGSAGGYLLIPRSPFFKPSFDIVVRGVLNEAGPLWGITDPNPPRLPASPRARSGSCS